MPIINIFPTANVTAGGTWTTPANIYAEDNAYASITLSAKGTIYSIEGRTFNIANFIKSNYTINSIIANVSVRSSVVPADGWSANFEVYDNTALKCNQVINALSTTKATFSYDVTSLFNYSSLISNPRIIVKTSTSNNKGYYTFYVDSVMLTINYTPPVAVTGVSLNMTSFTAQKGYGTRDIKATVLPENAYNKKVSWTSSNVTVASIDLNNVDSPIINCREVGTSILTVTTEDGGYTASCNIVVIDMIAPIISDIKITNITDSSATINFITDEPADSLIEYGKTMFLENSITDSSFTQSHAITINNLESGESYYYRIRSKDIYNNEKVADNGGELYSFTTMFDGIMIESSIDGINFNFLSKIPKGINEFNDYNITFGVTKYYRAYFMNTASGINSEYSNIIFITPQSGELPQPTSFINIDGTFKQAIVFINVNGVWKQATPWINVNGMWKTTHT